MKRNIIETVLGAVVLAVAVGFLIFAFQSSGLSSGGSGYEVNAQFDNASGLTPGAEVRMAGVKIGSVVSQTLNTDTFFADVVLTIEDGLHLPTDTSARIVPDGLLGSNYVSLEPGADEETIKPGGQLTYTQGAINVVDILGRFMFSSGDGKDGDASK